MAALCSTRKDNIHPLDTDIFLPFFNPPPLVLLLQSLLFWSRLPRRGYISLRTMELLLHKQSLSFFPLLFGKAFEAG